MVIIFGVVVWCCSHAKHQICISPVEAQTRPQITAEIDLFICPYYRFNAGHCPWRWRCSLTMNKFYRTVWNPLYLAILTNAIVKILQMTQASISLWSVPSLYGWGASTVKGRGLTLFVFYGRQSCGGRLLLHQVVPQPGPGVWEDGGENGCIFS